MGMLDYRISKSLRNPTIAQFGEVTEGNDRVAVIEIRPGMYEGQRDALMLRRWGHGGGYLAEGQPWHYSEREAAIEAAKCWVDTGRTPFRALFQ